MALSSHAVRALEVGLCDPDSAREIVTSINLGVAFAVPATNVAAIGTTTNITAVPGSFADAAAVQTYLAGANMVPRIESRLDVIEAKVDAVIAALIAAGLMAAS